MTKFLIKFFFQNIKSHKIEGTESRKSELKEIHTGK